MKIYSRIVLDIGTGAVIEEDSYPYFGPVALCDTGGGGEAATEAANVMAAAAAQAAKMQMDMYQQTREDMTPYREIGAKATPYYGGLLSLPGYDKVDPTAALRATPGYDWLLGQRTEALNRRAAARGMLESGPAGKELMSYGMGLADTMAYTPYMNRVGGLMNTGQNASAQTGQFGQQAAGSAGNYLMQGAQAQAQGILNSYQADQGFLGDMLGGLGMLGGFLLSPTPVGGFGGTML